MFSSRRKSREPAATVQNGFGVVSIKAQGRALSSSNHIPLPAQNKTMLNNLLIKTHQQQQSGVNSNALAAATAIGNALKTGQPIPRSNSLQRTSSIQRSSSFLNRKPPSRSGSLLGLQGPPANFQQPQQYAPQRSQSLTANSAHNRKLSAKKSTSSLSSGPRMVKKHIPGPYGLVTIEVPAEEEQKPKVKPKGSRSFTRISSDRGSLRSFQSTGSQSSSPRVKRAIVNEPLKEVDEEIPEDFEQTEQLHDPYESPNIGAPNLTLIQEEDVDGADVVANDFDQLKLQKENEELELEKKLQLEDDVQQDALNSKFESKESEIPSTASPVPTEIKDIKETIITNEPTLNSDGTVDGPHGLDLENEVLDEYTDIPSTAKSNDTITAGQSSYTTVDSEGEQEHQASSMAQQLRPTIPSLQVNNNKVNTNASPDTLTTSNGLTATASHDTPASSLYSNESAETDGVLSRPVNTISNESSQDLQIPARSSKRSSSTSPRKSALKIKSNSAANLHESSSNPANAAYLSLTTAENTRLNALSSSNLPAANLSRTNSSRHSLRQEPAGNTNVKTTLRQQPPQNGPRTTLRKAPPQQQQQQQFPKVSAPHQFQTRPQSVATARPEQLNSRPNRPSSAQGFRPQPQATASPRFSRQLQPQEQPQSPSNAAAVNAALKKNEPPKPALVRSSSFEKERPVESHSAFKRKSLRDPSINNHVNVESQLGFYRQQAAQQNHHDQQHQQQHHGLGHGHHESNGHNHGGGFAGFRSRFDDSDSDSEAIPTLRKGTKSNKKKLEHDFSPPPNNPTLRKPKSQFTLRNTSNSTVPENGSPAKSVPEKRNTRYFSEADKEQLFNEHLKKAEANMNGEKKKSKFGGKLKKLFGRGNN